MGLQISFDIYAKNLGANLKQISQMITTFKNYPKFSSIKIHDEQNSKVYG